MPVFFFDTEINGQVARDDEGLPFPDVRSARREAAAAIYGLASEVDPDISEVHAVLRVRNDADDVVLAFDMNLVISANAPRTVAAS